MLDVIVIGAGPSGMMAAITASQFGKKVLLCDKNETHGKKMKLSGGGRCNITNYKDNKTFIQNLPTKNGRFLYGALTNFGPHAIYDYFESHKVPLKLEKDDKVFPKSDKSSDFIEALKVQLNTNKVIQKMQTEVHRIDISGDGIKTVSTNQGEFKAKHVVIATGGKSYPHTGSTGFGHDLARQLGHEITTLFPTESPVLSTDPLITAKTFQGLAFTDVKLSLLDENNKVIKYHIHDLIFTHFGLSGPAALKLSQFVYDYLLTHKEATVAIDFIPEKTKESLIEEIKKSKHEHAQKSVKNIFMTYNQNRLIEAFIERLGIADDLKMANLSNQTLLDFVLLLKEFKVTVHGIKPITHAFVTGGGVNLKDINPKTMESKIIPGLYFTGEVLDLHGYTGGYNITIALSTGYTAGLSIAESQ